SQGSPHSVHGAGGRPGAVHRPLSDTRAGVSSTRCGLVSLAAPHPAHIESTDNAKKCGENDYPVCMRTLPVEHLRYDRQNIEDLRTSSGLTWTPPAPDDTIRPAARKRAAMPRPGSAGESVSCRLAT